MPPPAIRVENLGKEYQLGLRENGYKTLRESIMDLAAAPLRRLRHLSGKSQKAERIWALRDVSFEVQPGEVVGIIGRNGAGKSTLLKILTRITEPTTGKAEVRGRVGSLLEVGTGFHPELTGRENVFLNGAILGMPRATIKRKFDKIVDFSGVEKFLDTPVKRYSSGMRVRLAFAVAAHLDPEILLIDEVLAVGDAEFQKKCLGKMSDVASAGRTVLFVSHNMAAVQALCIRCLMLEKGACVLADATKHVVSTYLETCGTLATQDVALRTDRAGKGDVRVRKIEVLAPDLSPARGVSAGDALRLRFWLTEKAPSLKFIFAFYDEYGNLVADFDSGNASLHDERDRPRSDCVTCHIDQLALAPGVYQINTAVLVASQLQDHVEGALRVEVSEGVSRGRLIPTSTRGVTFFDHRWSFA